MFNYKLFYILYYHLKQLLFLIHYLILIIYQIFSLYFILLCYSLKFKCEINIKIVKVVVDFEYEKFILYIETTFLSFLLNFILKLPQQVKFLLILLKQKLHFQVN